MNKIDNLIEKMWNTDDSVWCFLFFMLPYLLIGAFVFGSIALGLMGF